MPRPARLTREGLQGAFLEPGLNAIVRARCTNNPAWAGRPPGVTCGRDGAYVVNCEVDASRYRAGRPTGLLLRALHISP